MSERNERSNEQRNAGCLIGAGPASAATPERFSAIAAPIRVHGEGSA